MLNTHKLDGVLLVGHGTRDAAGTAEFFQLSDLLAIELKGERIVRPCLLEFQKPDIREAWESLIEAQCATVTVAPLLLFAAGHAKSDIPDEIEAARRAISHSANIEVRWARPVTRQAAMIQAVRERLAATLARASSSTETKARSQTAIVMVGRGSRDVCATSDMRLLSEIVVRGRDANPSQSIADACQVSRDGLRTTFYAMASPRLPDTLESIGQSGKFERVIVHPHLLFSGRLYDAIVRQTEEASKRFPSIRFDVSDYLGPTPLVASAIAARIREVSGAAVG